MSVWFYFSTLQILSAIIELFNVVEFPINGGIWASFNNQATHYQAHEWLPTTI